MNEEQNKSTLDIPLKLHPQTFPRLYAQLRTLLAQLSQEKNPTLAEIFATMHPIVSQCYGVANERAADPLAAY